MKDFFFLDEEKWIVYTEIKIESFEKIKVKISHERNKFKIMWNCKVFLKIKQLIIHIFDAENFSFQFFSSIL